MNYIVPLGFGYATYIAFGHHVKACILYSLPAGDPLSTVANIFFILSIMGSFVLLSQPLYYIIETSGWFRSCSGY